MESLKTITANYYSVFGLKPYPKIRHSKIYSEDNTVYFVGTCKGTLGTYRLEIGLDKDSAGKVSYLSDVSYMYCDCPAYQYYVQDPLADVDAAPSTGFINRHIRNPDNIPAPCKHLYSYIQYIMTRGLITKANMRF